MVFFGVLCEGRDVRACCFTCWCRLVQKTASVLTGSSNEVLGPEDPVQEDIRQFDNVIVNFMRERGIPGASVAISKNGQLLFRKGERL